MRLAAWHPTTLTDFPDKVAAVLFTAGCNLRCPFCHNPELVLPARIDEAALLNGEEILIALKDREGFLDGVVITGGEPTLQPDLAEYVGRLKRVGLAVKLDTNGTRPDLVGRMIDDGLLDYVAIDAKAPPARYAELTGVDDRSADVLKTIDRLRRSTVDFEVRTTVAPGLGTSDIEAIVDWIGEVPRYVLQPFRVPIDQGKGLLDPTWADREALDPSELRVIWEGLADRFPKWSSGRGVRG